MKLPTANVPMVGQVSGIKGVLGLILGVIVLLFAFYAGKWVWNKIVGKASGTEIPTLWSA